MEQTPAGFHSARSIAQVPLLTFKNTQQEVNRKTLKTAVAEKQKKPKHVNQ
jgi:hypothetical protein